MTKPEIGSVWTSDNGMFYEVDGFDYKSYVEPVVCFHTKGFNDTWVMPLLWWRDNMEEVKSMTKPEIGSTWAHKSGNEYVVEGFANEDSTKEDYPVMIIYRNKENGTRWARKLSDWGRSMTQKDDNPPQTSSMTWEDNRED